MKLIQNSKGKIWYGMHFYPGVAEYQEKGAEPYRIFLNEDTLRSMDPTFAGRPLFVEHVNEVDTNVDDLRKDADGWVIESFFNAADGKHWVKFITVTEHAEAAIRSGMRLSNAYVAKSYGVGGFWNGVQYAKEVLSGEFEHLAIVRNPRYEESTIKSPEQFKAYNAEKSLELKRLANSSDKQEKLQMKFNIFKRTKVENSVDLEGMCVTLPSTGEEMTLTELVEKLDKIQNMKGFADLTAKVKVGKTEMSVKGLIEEHAEIKNELNAMKAKKNKEGEEDMKEEDGEKDKAKKNKKKNKDKDGDEDDMENEDEDITENEDEEEDEDEKAAKAKKNKKKNSKSDDEDEEEDEDEDKKSKAKKKADALRNAREESEDDNDLEPIRLLNEQVQRGRDLFGSN